MEFLKLLESIRNPVLDAFFSFVTHFGEETLFIVIGLTFFWCISKKQGYFMLFVGLFGTVVNQFLKLWFRIPRPWVKDESFTIVESARAEATGYSFPSGHTQASVGLFAGIARCCKLTWVRILTIVLCVLVPVSRMYLGVHTPLDVGVSVAIALILVFVLYPLVNSAMEKPWLMRTLLGFMALATVGFILFMEFYNFPAEDVAKADFADNYDSAIGNGYKMLGCFIGFWATYEIDSKFTHFETKAPLLGQILKVVLGIIPAFLIKTFLKQPLLLLCGGHDVAHALRYLLLALFAGALWPMTFKFFARLGKKNQ